MEERGQARKEEVSKMLLFKACSRCHGDMQINRDFYGDYKECLQCGMMVDIERDGGLIATVTESRASESTRDKRKVA